MRPISELSEKEIAERIEKNAGKKLAEAWSGKDLAEVVEQSGMSRVVLLVLFRTIAGKRLERMSEEMKNKFHARSQELKEASECLKKSNSKVWALMLPQKPSLEGLEPLMQMDLLADSMMKHSPEIGPFLKKNGQKDGLDLLVREILKRNKDFNCWAELARSLDAAGVYVSIDVLRSADLLRKKRDAYFDELQIEKDKRP